MKHLVVLCCLVVCSVAEARSQEVAAPNITADFTDDTVIIVTGYRTPRTLPLPYEGVVNAEQGPTLVFDDSFGEGRYEYRRTLAELTEYSDLELYSTWVEDPSDHFYGTPTRNGRSGRFVCRRPLLQVFECLPWARNE